MRMMMMMATLILAIPQQTVGTLYHLINEMKLKPVMRGGK